MIRIICGTCGTSQGYKSKADGAIILPATEEARLVARGVAAYVTRPVIGATAPQEGADGGQKGTALPGDGKGADGPENAGDGGESEMLTGHLDAAELETWKKGDLEKLAEEMGVDISKARNNAERAAILAAVEVQAPADGGGDDDGEAPPDLGAADIVS